ncbi:MAG: HlyD family efflux transporter periplasmic adaptor subunit [Planctomycetaceae bacterium]
MVFRFADTFPIRILLCCANARLAVAVLLWVAAARISSAQEPPAGIDVTISLARESRIPARDAGLLAEQMVKEGQVVEVGEVLAVLDNQQQTLQLAAAQLALAASEIQATDKLGLEAVEAQVTEARQARLVRSIALDIATAEAENNVAVQVATAETRLRQLELERALSARESFKGSISEAQLDRLKTAVAKGELEIEQARAEHRVLQMKPQAEQASLTQKDEEIRRLGLMVEQQRRELKVAGITHQLHQNELKVAELQLEKRNIRAPFDGVVAEVTHQSGEWVEPGETVARLIDLKTLRADGFLPAPRATQDLVGKLVRIRLNSAEARTVEGKITFVSPEIDPVNNEVRIRAEFDNSHMSARPGMTGQLVIQP